MDGRSQELDSHIGGSGSVASSKPTSRRNAQTEENITFSIPARLDTEEGMHSPGSRRVLQRRHGLTDLSHGWSWRYGAAHDKMFLESVSNVKPPRYIPAGPIVFRFEPLTPLGMLPRPSFQSGFPMIRAIHRNAGKAAESLSRMMTLGQHVRRSSGRLAG